MKVLSNEKSSFTTEKGGIVPSAASDHHILRCDEIIQAALEKAKVKMKEVGLIAYSQSPGIGNTLRIGAMAARSLAAIHKIPIIGVNHCIAHLTIGEVTTGAKDPVLLYASGANTQIIAYSGKKYRIFGETLDQGV